MQKYALKHICYTKLTNILKMYVHVISNYVGGKNPYTSCIV
jgi:hypothetical protein